MHPLISEKRPAISALCQRFGVKRLEVYGSAARGTDFDPARSDVDFLVEFSNEPNKPTLITFFDLQTELCRTLGRAVDLTEISAIRNPYLLAGVNQSRELIYGT